MIFGATTSDTEVTLTPFALELSLPLQIQIIAIISPPMAIQPGKPHCIKLLPAAPPWEATVEDVGLVVGDVDVLAPEVVVVLDAEVELAVEARNTPPAMAGGETLAVVFLAALL